VKQLRGPLDARHFNDLVSRVRDRPADVYAQVTECIASWLLSQIKHVVARVQGYVDAALFEVVPPDGMRGQGLPLLQALQAAARADSELRKTPLGRGVRVRFQRSEPAPEPEPEPERPPETAAPPVVVPPQPERAFDFDTRLRAASIWSSIKQQLAQHPELREPVVTIPAPPGMDADTLLECVAREAAADPAPLSAATIQFRAAPTVA
jgi:hypothetical protein